jgi:hypothetical protein
MNCIFQELKRCSRWLTKILWETPLHYTFSEPSLTVLTLEGWILWVLPRIVRTSRSLRTKSRYSGSYSCGDSFSGWGGIYTPSTLSTPTILPISTCNTQNSFTPHLNSPWPWFGEICWGLKEVLRARAWRVLVSWFPISTSPRFSLGWQFRVCYSWSFELLDG